MVGLIFWRYLQSAHDEFWHHVMVDGRWAECFPGYSTPGQREWARVSPSKAMAKHHPDLIMCRKQPGIAIGRLCEKCDGKCVICDSYVRPSTLVRVCDECNYGSYQGRCVICRWEPFEVDFGASGGGPGISDAFYCKECTQIEKDRDGCPKIVNLGTARTDLFYERRLGFEYNRYGYGKQALLSQSLGI